MTRAIALQWCDRVMYFSLLAVVFFLPISTAVVETGATFCITAFFFKRFIAFSLRLDELDAPRTFQAKVIEFFKILKPQIYAMTQPVGIFFFVTLLSVFASQYPGLSWKGFFGKTVEAVVLFSSVAECINTQKRLIKFLMSLAVSAILVSFDGIWQHFFQIELIFSKVIPYDKRITGPFHHPNDYGAYLVVVTAFFLGLLVWAWKSRRESAKRGMARFIFMTAGALITAAALGWTFSRGAWLGFVMAVFVLVLLGGKKQYIPIIFLVIFWVIFSSQLGAIRNVSFITDDISMDGRQRVQRLADEKEKHKTSSELFIEDIASILSRFSGAGRQVFWTETMRVVKSSPVYGTGLNTFSQAAKKYNVNWTGYYSHNCYLQMFAETGILGLSSFLWIMFVLTRETVRAIRKMDNVFYKALLTAVFSGVAGFWFHSSLDTNFYSAKLGNLMWLMMGLIVAIIHISGQNTVQSKK